MPRTKNEVVSVCVDALKELFPDVPVGYAHCSQTFEQRIEGWVLHAIDELEEELNCGGDDFFGKEDEEDDDWDDDERWDDDWEDE